MYVAVFASVWFVPDTLHSDSHLCESLPEDQLHTKAHQLAPEPTTGPPPSDSQILRQAIKDAKKLYGLAGSPMYADEIDDDDTDDHESNPSEQEMLIGEREAVAGAATEAAGAISVAVDHGMEIEETADAATAASALHELFTDLHESETASVLDAPGVNSIAVDTETPAVSRGVQTESWPRLTRTNAEMKELLRKELLEPLSVPGSRFQSPTSPVNASHESAIMT